MHCHLTLLLSAVFLFSCQTSEGLVFQSGTARSSFAAGWDSSEVQDGGSSEEVTTLQGQAQAGAFLSPSIEFGLDLDYFDQEVAGATSTSMGIGLYGRYWFQQKGNARAWVEAAGSYSDLDLDGDSDSGISWSGAAGISQFLTTNSALEASLQYSDQTYELTSGSLGITSTSILLGYAIFY